MSLPKQVPAGVAKAFDQPKLKGFTILENGWVPKDATESQMFKGGGVTLFEGFRDPGYDATVDLLVNADNADITTPEDIVAGLVIEEDVEDTPRAWWLAAGFSLENLGEGYPLRLKGELRHRDSITHDDLIPPG